MRTASRSQERHVHRLGAATACPAGHLCDGFDRTTAVDATWAQAGQGSRTVLAIDPTIGDRTPNGALSITTQAGDATDWIEIAHTFGGLTSFHASFSLRRGDAITSGQLQVMRLAGADGSDVFVYIDGSQIGLAEYVDPQEVNMATGAPLMTEADTWHRLDLDIDFGARTARLAGNGSTITLPLKWPHPPPMSLAIGALSLPTKTAATVWLDDLDLAAQ